jgi:hypothetical protein
MRGRIKKNIERREERRGEERRGEERRGEERRGEEREKILHTAVYSHIQ